MRVVDPMYGDRRFDGWRSSERRMGWLSFSQIHYLRVAPPRLPASRAPWAKEPMLLSVTSCVVGARCAMQLAFCWRSPCCRSLVPGTRTAVHRAPNMRHSFGRVLNCEVSNANHAITGCRRADSQKLYAWEGKCKRHAHLEHILYLVHTDRNAIAIYTSK